MQTHGLPCWTSRPDAKAILESCSKSPPTLCLFSRCFGLTRELVGRYRGQRADSLDRIRDRHLRELTGADFGAPDPDAQACRHYLSLDRAQPTVEAAIDAAVEGREVPTVEVDLSIAAAIPPRVGGRRLAA